MASRAVAIAPPSVSTCTRSSVIWYSLDVGATIMTWDFGEDPSTSIVGYAPMRSSTEALRLAPSFSLLLQSAQ